MKQLSCIVSLLVCCGLVGCKPSSTVEKSTATTADNHGHDHPHSHGDRDHSVQGHSHGEGPHGGTIADWGGGKYHVEFTVDHDQKQSTIYILGTDEKTAVAIASETVELSIKDPQIQIVLTPSPQDGDPQGKASRFVGSHESLGIVREFAGTMTAVIDGTPYSGDFNEADHGDHNH